MSASEWVVRNGDWFLSEGPDWSVSTWTTLESHASTFRSRDLARAVAEEAKRHGCRPFGRDPSGAVAAKKKGGNR